MRILIDSNVLISAVLSPNGTCAKAIDKVMGSDSDIGIISDQNLDELLRFFSKKYPHQQAGLDMFLSKVLPLLEVIHIPKKIIETETLIRDVSDRPILRSALAAKVDILLTGDRDFLESRIKKPCILSPADFLGWNDLLEGRENIHMMLYDFVKAK